MTVNGHLADELRRIGRQEGLRSVGICDARPFSEERAVIEARKQAGWSGGMQFTYRNPARSTDPSRTMAGAQALFVGALGYARTPSAQSPDSPAARVARYAWTDHYQILRRALGCVADRLRDEGWRAMVLADDNSLVDRAAAVRAGLGWYGKNANVLLPEAGSWFVLGSVLTDAPIHLGLTPVALVADGCSTCRRCLDSCPTGALVGPGQLDARRCLAWLLQQPGVFPREYRAALGDRIYGCDDCQEVCPINRRAERTDPSPLAEPEAQVTLDVLALLEMDDSGLDALIGRWYIPGRELRYVRRNALIVLGNTGDGSDGRVVAAVRRALVDRDPILRAHAVWAAQALGRDDLLDEVVGDDDPLVREELAGTGTDR